MHIVLRPGALEKVRKGQGLPSRDELARRIGITTTTVYRVDAGRVEPSTKFMAALMAYTGLKFEDLFEIVGEAA